MPAVANKALGKAAALVGRTTIVLLCALPWLPSGGPGRPGASPALVASAAGVAAEGPPVLSPLIGPAQERDAIARRQQLQQLQQLQREQPQHRIRHQHHYGDPRLSSRHPAPGLSEDGLPPAPAAVPVTTSHAAAEAVRAAGLAAHHGGGGPGGGCQHDAEHLASLVTRNLEGICSEKETGDRVHNLGVMLADQLNVLKTMILNLEDKVGAMDIGMERSERRLLAASRCSRAGAEDDADGADAAAEVGAGAADEDDDDADYGDNPAFVTVRRDGAQGPSAREEEVQRFNNTVYVEQAPHATGPGCGLGHRAFSYYWRVRNMDYKMTGWSPRRSLRSPSFYVWPGGYRMYLRMYPRQAGENVYVHVGLTKGDNDASLPWPFRLRHRLAVLDQVSTLASSAPAGQPGSSAGSAGSGPADLVSRVWDPSQLCSGYNWQRPTVHAVDNYECVGLGFPQTVLRSRSYVRMDAALVKLTVCLDQP